MAESTDQSAPVSATSVPPSAPSADYDPPPETSPAEPNEVLVRYRKAAPWIIGVFGLMGAVILLAVPMAALSEIEPSSRRTIVLASILAFLGVAVAIIASSVALAPRISCFSRPMEPRRSRVLRWVSARRAVEDAWARENLAGSERLDPEPARQRLYRFEKERNAVRVGFAGVLLGAVAIGTAMGIMVWEFEDPTTVFEIDRIHADTIRIQTEARRLAAETNRIEAEVAQIEVATKLEEGELAVQSDKLTLDLELLQESIAQTRADTARLNAEAEAAPLIEVIVGQIADVELAIEAILEQLVDLKVEVRDRTNTIAG